MGVVPHLGVGDSYFSMAFFQSRAGLWNVLHVAALNFIAGCRLLAKFSTHEISGLADRFLMEIVTNVNSGQENGSFQRYLLTTKKICNRK
jgi:hypothetical protein